MYIPAPFFFIAGDVSAMLLSADPLLPLSAFSFCAFFASAIARSLQDAVFTSCITLLHAIRQWFENLVPFHPERI